jgi:V/A-type H+-transporting ATPase subunit I
LIARMEKVFMAGPKRLVPTILHELQGAGVVQIDPLRTDEIDAYQLSDAEQSLLGRWDAAATSADHALRLLEFKADPSVKPFEGNLEEAEAAVSTCEHRAAALVEKQEHLRGELELIDQYREVVELLAETVQGLDESPRLAVLPFVLDNREALTAVEQELASTLDDRFVMAQGPVGGTTVAVIIVLERDAEEAKCVLSHQGLAELPRPGEYTDISLRLMHLRLQERSRSAPQELAATEEALRQMRKETGGELKALFNRAKDEAARLHTLREMASGRYGFVLFGWVPVHLQNRVIEVLRRFEGQIIYTFEPADVRHEADHIPVMLENADWVRPFESLISFLGTPRYDSWDPTWMIAVFFPLWFGMIVGDFGYAVIFAALYGYLAALVRRNRPLTVEFFKMHLSPDAVAQVLGVLKPMIGWTVLWGFLYGECFGDLLQRIGVFGAIHDPGWIPILIPRTDTIATANGLILFSIGFGVYQVLYGFYLKALRTRRQGEKVHFWEACGYFGGVAALVLVAYAFMTGDHRLWCVVPIAVGVCLFLIGMIRARAPLMIAELPTQGGHIMSYIRIYAVGLASAILAKLATDMGFSLYHLLGSAGLVIGMIAALLLGLLIHAVLIVLLTVSHLLQPIRLIWVEFFTKFDFYTISGRPYRPFKLICKPS